MRYALLKLINKTIQFVLPHRGIYGGVLYALRVLAHSIVSRIKQDVHAFRYRKKLVALSRADMSVHVKNYIKRTYPESPQKLYIRYGRHQ